MLRFRYDVSVEARSPCASDAQFALRPITDAFKRHMANTDHDNTELHLLQDFYREGFGMEDLEMARGLLSGWRVTWPPREWREAEQLRVEVRTKSACLEAELKRSVSSVLQKSNPDGRSGPFAPDTVHAYQWQGTSFVSALWDMNKKGAAIFDAMGLGKTLQALMVMVHLACCRGLRRVVIVCPNQEIRHQWSEEFRTWGLEAYFGVCVDEMVKLADAPSYPESSSQLHAMTATPNWLRHAANLDKLQRTRTLVVVDEAHLAKNAHSGSAARTSQIFRALKKLARRERVFTLLLTGTPMPNAKREFFAYFDLMQCLGMDFPEFAFRYCDRKRKSGVPDLCWDDTGTSAEEEFKELQTHCIARPSQDLPEERFERFLPLNMSAPVPTGEFEGCTLQEAFVAYAERETKLRADLRKRSLSKDQKRAKSDALQSLSMRRWELSAAAKAPAMAEELRKLLRAETPSVAPLIVFAFHMCMFDALERVAQDFPEVSFGSVNGRVSDANTSVDAFKDGEIKVLFVSLSKTSGLNLQICRRTWFAEIPWSWGDRRQAEKRTNRMGQKADSVEYVYWLGEAPATCGSVYRGTFRKEKNIKRALRLTEAPNKIARTTL